MPARNSSMELSSPSNPDVDASVQPSRRKSGRVTKPPPDRTYPSPSSETGATKRKHSEAIGDVDQDDSDDQGQSSEGEPDAEELREKKRKARKTKTTKTASSRSKTKTISGALPVRTAAQRLRKPRKGAAAAAQELAGQVGGLYGQVFGPTSDLRTTAAEWNTRFDAHQANALTEIVNLLLRASGCDIQVNSFDIEDPDNAPNRLADIQQQFQDETLVSDYPIISKSKGGATFKRTLVAFFDALIVGLANSGVLYDTPDLVENIEVWVGAMSSAAHRPFRHTATVVALAIIDGLCAVGKATVAEQAKLQRQYEGEEKKQKVNKGRLADLKQKSEKQSQQRVQLDGILQDWSDTVFVHRYRDVDFKIRVDCVAHLSNWIMLYPELFFDGQHLRYLGWLLSDPSPQTRQEVLSQLQKFYKDQSKVAGLQQFTARFRPRVIEMALQDAEPSVRVSAIETIDTVRDAGLLEPDDIDTVGKLIYDAEQRVRKAVVPFFAASVVDSYEDKIAELGGEETLQEGLPTIGEDDEYFGVRMEWLKFKSLAELLTSFDPDDASMTLERSSNDLAAASGDESRFSMAAQAFLSRIQELSDWQILAGYLLFDNTQVENHSAVDVESQFKQQCVLGDKEEALLLDVLNEAVKASLADGVKDGKAVKKTKREQLEVQKRQEEAAQSLAVLIPKLLNKFGAAPAAASAVLRLQRLMNLDVFQELRQDSTTYTALLDDIQKQFMSHETKDVVSEASNALLHARSFQGLGEITDERMRSIWNETAYALIAHCLGEELELRGAIDTPTLTAISATVLRISSLARVSDCVDALETPQKYIAAQRRRKSTNPAPQLPLNHLLTMLDRGRPDARIEPNVSALEDTLVSDIISALLCYFLWQSKRTQSGSTGEDSVSLLQQRIQSFTSKLIAIIARRSGADQLKLDAAEALLDLHVVFTVNISTDAEPPARQPSVAPLAHEVQMHLVGLFAAVEKDFAKAARKKLGEPSEDEDPEDISDAESDDDDEPAEDENEAETQERQARIARKQRNALLAEDRLCSLTGKLVLAIISGILDAPKATHRSGNTSKAADTQTEGSVRRRICRNKGRLGLNFKEVIAALDKPTEKGKARGKKASAKATKPAKSTELVEPEDDEDGDSHMADGDADEEQLQRNGIANDEEAAAVSRRDLEVEEDASPVESVIGD